MLHKLCCFPSVLLGLDSLGRVRVTLLRLLYFGLPEVAPRYFPSSHLLQYPYLSVLNSVQYFLATIFPTTSRDDEE